MNSLFNWRTPLFYGWFLGSLPQVSLGRGILIAAAYLALASTAFVCWKECGVAGGMAGSCFLAGALFWCLYPEPFFFSELWAGILLVLSTSLYFRNKYTFAAAIGVLALFVRELSLPYCAIATLVSLKRHRWTECVVWTFGLAAYAVYVSAHARRVSAQVPLGGAAQIFDWLQVGGVKFVVNTTAMNYLLYNLPHWCAATYLALSLVGMAVCRSQELLTARISLVVYCVSFYFIGKPVNAYWGWMTAPLMAVGFACFVKELLEQVGFVQADRLRIGGRAACDPGARSSS